MGVLRRHCEAFNRDINEIVRSTNMNVFLLAPGEDPERATAAARGDRSYEEFARGNFVATPDQFAAHVEQLMEAGINYLITSFSRVAYDHSQLEAFAQEVMPRFKA